MLASFRCYFEIKISSRLADTDTHENVPNISPSYSNNFNETSQSIDAETDLSNNQITHASAQKVIISSIGTESNF